MGYEGNIPKNGWFDEECVIALEERNKARKEYINRPTRTKYKVFQEKRRIANQICRKKKRESWNTELNDMEENFTNNNLRSAFKKVNAIKKGFVPKTDLIRSENGIISGKRDILIAWREHFMELLNKGKENDNNSDNNSEGDNYGETEGMIEEEEEEIEPPDTIDVSIAISALKNNKAPGSDNIPAELIKKGGKEIETAIYRLITRIWQDEQMPKEWKTGIICPIYKKGDKLKCQNYRGITLLSNVYKIFTYILRKKLEKHYESTMGEYQGGFRTGRSTIDQIFVVKRMAEKFREYGVDLHHLFIDFRTAYDSINRSMLYRILAELGTHPKIIRLIKMTMSESIGQVKIFGGITDPFPINTGLKQGDGLAPILFNMALHWAVNKTQVDLQNTLLYKSIQICRRFEHNGKNKNCNRRYLQRTRTSNGQDGITSKQGEN